MVRLATLLPMLISAAGLASAQAEQVVNGTKFITSGPAVAANWHEYWYNTSVTALHTLKALLGPQGLKDLLKPEIAKGDAFWQDIVQRSSGSSWKAARGRTVAFLPEVTAASFARWTASPLADMANLDGNAEHYFKTTTVNSTTGVIASEIIEGWGGVVTHFTVPNFSAADHKRYPMLDPLPDFPIQFAGDKTLMDGTVFGVLHIAVRDVAAGEFPNVSNSTGIEVAAAVWYGDASEEDHLEAESQHIIIEEINLTRQCQLDIIEGRLPTTAATKA